MRAGRGRRGFEKECQGKRSRWINEQEVTARQRKTMGRWKGSLTGATMVKKKNKEFWKENFRRRKNTKENKTGTHILTSQDYYQRIFDHIFCAYCSTKE